MSQLESRYTLDNSGFIAKMVENGTVTEREAKRMQKSLDYVSSQLKVMERETKSAAAASGDLKEASGHMEELGFKTAGAKRELLVLGHELSQGNYKRFAGSILVLGERTGAASLLFSALGIAAIGATAAVSLFTGAVIKGALETEALRKSLVLTGNFAGVTEGQFNAMSKTLASSTGVGISKTREALQALISTGEVGPRVLGPLAASVVLYAKATGETEESVAKDFAKMGDGVAKWAAEHNKQMNFITLAQYEYIRRLEEQGKKEEAELVVAKALSDHLGGVMKPNLGLLERAWKSLGETASETWDAMKGVGRAGTVEDAIEKQLQRIDAIRMAANAKPVLGSSGLPKFNTGAAEEAAIDDLRLLKLSQTTAAVQALGKADEARKQKAGIAADDYLRKIDEERKGTTRLALDLAELHKQIDAKRAAGGIVSAEDEAAQEKFIRFRDRSHDQKTDDSEAKRLATSIKERLNLYAEEIAKLKAQEAEYEKYGKVLDRTAVDIALVDVSTGKFAKANFSLKSTILAAAAAEDEQAKKTKASGDAAKKKAEELKKQEEAEKALSLRLKENLISTELQVERLQEDTNSLHLNTLQRQIAIEALKIEKDRRRELADPKNAGHEDAINANAAQRTKEITAALVESDKAAKSFATGSARAFTQYGENAANAAKFAEEFVGGSISRLEDALVTFAETGKLNLGSLFKFMADEFIRNQIRMQLASVMPGGSNSGSWLGSLISLAGTFFGGGTGEGMGAGSVYANTNLPTAGGRAAGGPVAAGTAYVVGERGPEILRMGNVPGNIIPNGGAAGAGGDIHYHNVYNIGQGVSRAEMVQAVEAGQAQQRADLMRQRSRQTGVFR